MMVLSTFSSLKFFSTTLLRLFPIFLIIFPISLIDFTIIPGGKQTVPFRKAINRYYAPGSRNRTYSSYNDFKCYGYVLYASRNKDDREVYAYGSTPQLKEALYTIVGLKTGDVVDENFQVPEVEEINGRRFPQRPSVPAEDAPIIIR